MRRQLCILSPSIFLSSRLVLWALLLFVSAIPLEVNAQFDQRARLVSENEYVIVPPTDPVVKTEWNDLFWQQAISAYSTFEIQRDVTPGALMVTPPLQPMEPPAGSRVLPNDPTDPFCADLIARKVAKLCSPNIIYSSARLPDDPLYSILWGLPHTKAPRAWDFSVGYKSVVVAVLDTGVDYLHPDISPNMWANPFEIPANGIDDERNGYVDDVVGANVLLRTGNPYDNNSHGTHVAGVLGARGNNTYGTSGVAWRTSIMAVKFLDAAGNGTLESAVRAIDYVIDMKRRGVNVRVINSSWGSFVYDPILDAAVKRARDVGIIFVSASGNHGTDTTRYPFYPSSLPHDNIVAVTAIDWTGEFAALGNWGSGTVDIGAPGLHILSTIPGGGYGWLSGTSVAAPHVSGAFSLLFTTNPELTMAQAIARLYNRGTDLPRLIGNTTSGRMLNVARLLRLEEN